MTADVKVEICKLRYEGCSATEIAQRCGVSPSSVMKALQTLPAASQGTRLCRPKMDMPDVERYCRAYFSGSNVRQIAEEYGVPETHIQSLLCFLRQKRVASTNSSACPALAEWMRTNQFSQAMLAKATGLSLSKLNHVLNGGSFLDLSSAKQIAGFTKVPLGKLYPDSFTYRPPVWPEDSALPILR